MNMHSSVSAIPIGDVVRLVQSWNPRSLTDGETINYIDIGSVSQTEKAILPTQPISAATAPSRARQMVATDDILVSTVRPNLNTVARVAEHLDGATASTGFCVLRPDQKRLDPGYLFHWVRAPAFIEEMTRSATGQSYPAVSERIVKQSTIPLPPLAEQKRIAAILDQADALRRLRRRALDRLNMLGQAIFQEMFGDGAHLPEVPLGTLLTSIDSGKSPKCLDRTATPGEWGVLKLSAVTSGVFRPEENKALPDPASVDARHEVHLGDLLFTRKNTMDLVAATAIVRSNAQKLLLPDLIFRLKIKQSSPVGAEYLHALLSSPRKRKSIQSLAGGAAGSMPNISKTKLLDVSIPIPPPLDETRFARTISSLESARQAASRQFSTAETLFSSLQHRAFTGQL